MAMSKASKSSKSSSGSTRSSGNSGSRGSRGQANSGSVDSGMAGKPAARKGRQEPASAERTMAGAGKSKGARKSMDR